MCFAPGIMSQTQFEILAWNNMFRLMKNQRSGEVRQLIDFGPEIINSLRSGHAMVVDSIALDP